MVWMIFLILTRHLLNSPLAYEKKKMRTNLVKISFEGTESALTIN